MGGRGSASNLGRRIKKKVQPETNEAAYDINFDDWRGVVGSDTNRKQTAQLLEFEDYGAVKRKVTTGRRGYTESISVGSSENTNQEERKRRRNE